MDNEAKGNPFTSEVIEKLEKSPFGIGGVLIHSLAISAHDDFLACADWEGRLHVFERRTGKKIVFLKPKEADKESFRDVVFHPKKNLLACFNGNKLEFREPETGRLVRTVDQISTVCRTNRGEMFLATGDSNLNDEIVQIWDWASDKPLKTINLNRNLKLTELPNCVITFSADGKMFASYGMGPLQVWDIQAGKLIHKLTKNDHNTWFVSFSPDGQTLAALDRDGFVHLWDVKNGARKHRFQADAANRDYAHSLQVHFSPDGKVLATCGWEKLIRLFDPATGKKIGEVKTEERIACFVFSRDGSRLFSAGERGIIRQWDTKTWQEIQPTRP